jgi:hypothetical protein
MVPPYAGMYGIWQKQRKFYALDELTVLLDDAIESGALSEVQADDVSVADEIVRGRRRSEGAEVFLVVEAS